MFFFAILSFQLKEKMAASQPSATVSRAPRSSDGSSDEGHMSEPMDILTQPEPEGDTSGPLTSTDRSTKVRGKGKTTQPPCFLDLVAQLQEQQDANESLQRQVRSVLEQPVNIPTSSMFGSFMASMVETRVRSHLQPQFYQECFALLMNYVDQPAQVTTPVPQPITQPMPQTSFQLMQNPFNLDPRFVAQQERRRADYTGMAPPRSTSVDSMWGGPGPSGPEASLVRPETTAPRSSSTPTQLDALNISGLSSLSFMAQLASERSNLETPSDPPEHEYQD